MMPALPPESYYLFLAVSLFGAAALLIPKRAFPRVFSKALIAGSIAAFLFQLVFGRWLNLFYYTGYGAFHLFQMPFWVLLAWTPAMMIFLYFLPERSRSLLFWGYFLGFCMFSVALDVILKQLGLLHYNHWGPIHRFAAAVLWFCLAAKYGKDPA